MTGLLSFDPPKSPVQKRLMEAAAHTPGGYGGVSQMVGKEFIGKDETPATAAGTIFVTPEGLALFLKRSASSDNPGTWAWPAGGIEGDETPQEAARRETSEEIGFANEEDLEQIDHQANGESAFATFFQGVGEPFLPKINHEHSAYAWAPLSDPPQPLHPGVEATLEKLKATRQQAQDEKKRFRNRFAFDKATARRLDADGRLHVAITNISKANVCPYLGKEIPNAVELGLTPDKVYMLYRDPVELAKAVPTFNNIPLLSKHIETTAEDHKKDDVIGSTGTDAQFNPPYLQNSLVIWDGPYIEMVEDESQKELSPAYRYRADMTPGEIDGVKFDGVMRDIIGNHVALVKEGRTGSDVVVGDSKEELTNMAKTALSLKAVMARGALSAFLAPRLAADSNPKALVKAISLSTVLGGVTAKNFKDKKAGILKWVTEKGKLAKDDSEGLKTLLDALEGTPVLDEGDPMDDAAFSPEDLNAGVLPMPPKETEGEGKDDPMASIMEFLKGKLSPEDLAQVQALCAPDEPGATDDPPPFVGKPEKPGLKPNAAVPPAKDKDMVSKEDMDKAVKGASDAVRAEVNKNAKEIRDAERLVKPYVGELAMAHDSAVGVLKTALGALDVKGIDKIDDLNALTVILQQQPLPGAKTIIKSPLASDAKGASSFAERFPGASRIKNL